MSIFDQHIDTTRLSRKKWEYEIERTGYQDLLSFGTADMDYHSPQPILEAIKAVAEEGHLGYPHIRASYYSTIEDWLSRNFGWKVNARKAVLPHVGIYMSCITAMDAFSEAGDEIIIQTPVHARFAQLVRDNGRVPVANPLKLVHGRYEMDYEQLESCITGRSKILWLCNPHNPVGRAWTAVELRKLGDICLRYGLRILTDDIYCDMVYPGHSYVPIASLSQELRQITISCYSPSKCFNTTGVNQSFTVIENEEMQERYKKSLHKTDLDYAISTIGLAVTEAAYNGSCDQWMKEFMVHVKGNYDFLVKFVQEKMPGAKVVEADSTYFGWVDLRCLAKSEEAADIFLNQAHVLVNDGAALGQGGKGFIRINLACPQDILEEGLIRMGRVYQAMASTSK
jgi:cystathionine beta-lyase